MLCLIVGLGGFSLGCSRNAPSPRAPINLVQFNAESGPFTEGKKVVVASGCFGCHNIDNVHGPVGDLFVAVINEGDEESEESSGGFQLGNLLDKPFLDTLDKDKDGKLSKEELVAGVKQFFSKQDTEKTGKLTQQQIADGLSAIIKVPPRFWGNNRPWGLGEAFAPQIFRRADIDKDGKITQPELIAAAEAVFAEFDKGKKGKLDQKQIAKAMNLLGTSPEVIAQAKQIRGPDLGKVGQDPDHTVDWFKAYIQNPKSKKPDARMPSFVGKIKDDDLNALAEYLASLK
jgi:Ca2+-binding EF-hand superfamily protein/cytochrome c2